MSVVPFEEILRVDGELYRLVRTGSAVRLQMAEALEALASSGGHGELGFVSVEAYARERCDRSGRWAADLRSMARRLAGLPRVRLALARGEIGWSMAEVLARAVTPGEEEAQLAQARRSTVRQMRERLSSAGVDEQRDCGAVNAWRTLTLTMSPEESWFLEATWKLMERVSGKASRDEMMSCLLAEAWTEMSERDSDVALGPDTSAQLREKREAELERWRRLAEERCERRMGADLEEMGLPADVGEITSVPPGATAEEFDERIRELARELSERDLAEGMLFEQISRAEAWRRFGYASQSQYVRERLGVSWSGLKAKRALALRAVSLPELREALATKRIGQASGALVSRVASPGTVSAWIERAERRTVKHLREEVEIAEMIIRNTGIRYVHPPSDAVVRTAQAWEARVKSGAAWRAGDVLGQSGLDFLAAARGEGSLLGESASQKSGGGCERAAPFRAPLVANELGIGRVTVRLRVLRETREFFRGLEAVYERRRQDGKSFVTFLCDTMWKTWGPTLKSNVAYARIYERDRFECANPTCTRTVLNPHHIVFRAHGGGDEDENLVSLCVWCHLEGVHGGRMRVRGRAPGLDWEIGRRGLVAVRGRERVKGQWKRGEVRGYGCTLTSVPSRKLMAPCHFSGTGGSDHSNSH